MIEINLLQLPVVRDWLLVPRCRSNLVTLATSVRGVFELFETELRGPRGALAGLEGLHLALEDLSFCG